MPDHLVTITSVDRGDPAWSLECHHDDDAQQWVCTNLAGEADPAMIGECWLRTWWDEVGSDLLDITGPITTLPIAVRPCDNWSFDDGGFLVRDTVAEADADNLSAEALALIGRAAMALHTKTFRTVSDEVWNTNAACTCGSSWPCLNLRDLLAATGLA